MRVLFLGTGTSHGVPAIQCRCAVCTSPDPRNVRARCAVVVSEGGRSVLIDTPPELRHQAIRFHLERVDAVLFTHAHADHIFGLDDIRRFNDLQGGEMPCYGSAETLADIERAFRYAFVETQAGGGKPRLQLHTITAGPLTAAGIEVEAIPILHGKLPVFAYRFGSFAYVTDASEIPPASRDRLRGVDTLVLGALRHREHPTHFSVAQALEAVADLAPRRAFFTHMAHDLEHRATEAELPAGVRLAYDGLILEI
jgi:phosphoribosyl 1,2-cyclic phosphate phosphodiesterase